MTTWVHLTDELDRWQADGRVASLWWRDDDAIEDTPALHRLISIATSVDAPLALSVVPAPAKPSLGNVLSDTRRIHVLQHGYTHRNHAANGAKKIELGGERDRASVEGDLIDGRRCLDDLAGDAALPILVPPWNRIDDAVLSALPALGYQGISTFRPRTARTAIPPVRQVNAHVDIVDWRSSRQFCGEETALSAFVGHLAARRIGAVDGDEPTGLLTHHLVHDDAGWAFVVALSAAVTEHDAACWLSAAEAFEITQ